MATPAEQVAVVRAESMRLLLRQIPIALAVNIVNATLVALVLYRVARTDRLAIWWTAMLVVVSGRLLYWWRESPKEAIPPEDVELWQRRALIGSVISGTLWGGGAFLLFPDQELYQLFLAFVVGGMAAGATASLSYSLPIYFGYLLPSILPLALRFLLEATPVDFVAALMVLIFATALSLFARNQHKVFTSALTLQLEKSRLAAELSSLLQSLEERVRQRTEELQVANEKLKTEVAERERAEVAERRARAEAEQANAAKSIFLAAASHDLRQPIQGLQLYLDVLNRELTTDRQQSIARHLATVVDNARLLLDTLMDLSALESGKVAPALRDCALDVLVNHMAEECRIEAQRKGLQLRVRTGRSVIVTTDPVLFSRMLRNLVANAVRHTTQGKILITCRRRADHARVEVWDTGPGIPGDQLTEIFGAFYQVNRGLQVPGKGLGLGLWIVARTAQLLHHDIGVKSRPGHGSVFSVTLPLSTRTAASTP